MTREEKIAAIKSARSGPVSEMSREDKIDLIKQSRQPMEPPVQEQQKLPSPQMNVLGPMQGLIEQAPVVGEYYKMPRVAAESALSSMSMGLTDPLLAGLEGAGAYGQKYAEALGKEWAGKPAQYPTLSEEYQKAVDIKRKERERNQLSSAGGSIAGAVSPVGAPAKIAGFLGKGIKGAGFLSGLGRGAVQSGTGIATQTAEEEVKDLAGTIDPSQKVPLADKLKYGGIATLASPVAEKVVSGMGKLAGKMKGESIAMKLKQVGAIQKDFKKFKPGEKEKLFETMKKYGIAAPGDSFDDVLAKTGQLKEEAGEGVGAVYSEYGKKISDPKFIKSIKPKDVQRLQKVSLNPDTFADDLVNDMTKELTGTSGGRQLIKSIKSEALNLKDAAKIASESGESHMGVLLKYRRTLDDKLANVWKKLPKDRTPADDALVEVRRKVQGRIDDHLDVLDDIFGTKELAKLKEQNKLYSEMTKLNDLAQDGVARVEGNRMFGLTESIAGTGAGAANFMSSDKKDADDLIKSLLVGAGVAAGSRVGRTYGPGMMSPILEKGASKAGLAAQLIDAAKPGLIGPRLAPKGKKDER